VFNEELAMLELEPSINTWTRAVRPARKSRVNPGGFAGPHMPGTPDSLRQFGNAVYAANDAESLGIGEMVDEFTSFCGAIFIQHQCCYMLTSVSSA